MAVLGLRFCARAFSSCGKQGPLFIAVRGPLTIAASLVVEHRLQMRRLSSCGSRAQLLHSMWDLPRPGLEPMSPALAGRFSTTAPPGKPTSSFYRQENWDQRSQVTCPKLSCQRVNQKQQWKLHQLNFITVICYLVSVVCQNNFECLYCYKNISWDFPGGPVVKNPPYNAGDAGSIPGRGTRFPHATGQLSPRATATELARLN